MKTCDVRSDGVTVREAVDAKQERRWDCTPDQAEKHLPTWRDGRAGQISAGDASAITDAAREYEKQRDA